MKSAALIFTLALTIGLEANSAVDAFDTQAQSLLDRFNLKLGNSQEVLLNGQSEETGADCTVRVVNSTKLSQTFPESSKLSQKIEVSVTEDDRFEKFSFGRETDVLGFLNQITTGASMVKISVKNKTGLGSSKMKQAIAIKRSSGMGRPLTVSVTGFSKETLSCTISSRK